MTIERRAYEDGLIEGDIHIWTTTFDSSSGEPRKLARTWGREILSAYLGCRPRHVPIERAGNGKPTLEENAADGLSFSLSHSGSRAAMAVAAGRRIGVDLERLRPLRDPRALATRFFAPEEAEALASLEAGEAATCFFRTWVRKEAYLKGLGGSVPAGLRRFRVPVGPTAQPSVQSTELEEGRSAFRLRDLDAASGYVGALAVEGDFRRVVQMCP